LHVIRGAGLFRHSHYGREGEREADVSSLAGCGSRKSTQRQEG